ncbi:MAG TPA: hypothetical protein VFT08_09450 [Pyrinomonadaceae bacterium]|nr:hypothetical protein [Pyrinomonadaceae bacterium]
MKRPPDRLTISVFVLVVLALGLVVSAGPKTHAARTTPELSSRGPSLTIIFRGLMTFRRDDEEQTLSVEILPAPEHEFTIQVLEKSPQGISTYSIPVSQVIASKNDTLLAEFATKRYGVSYYQNGVFDRTKDTGDSRDFRWLIDLEGKEFYGHKLAVDQRQIGVAVKFSNGEFYTKTTTRPLQRRMGSKTFEDFGRVAHEIATDVFLEDGDFVLTSQASGAEVLRLKQKPDTTYELVFENAPSPMQHPAMRANHFQFYYRLFPMPKSQWYEFRVVPRELAFAHAPSTDEIPCMPTGTGGGRK